MPAPVVVKFQVDGIDALQRAFRTVEDSVARSERASAAAVTRGARERVQTSQREARDREREFSKLAREAEKWQRQEVRDADKAAKDKERAEQQWARTREQIQNRSATMAGRLAAQEVRDAQRAADEKARIAERTAQKEANAAKRAHEEQTRSRIQFANTIAGAGTTGVKAGINRIGGITSSIAGTALQLGGGFAIADAVKGTMDAQRNAALLANSAYLPGNAANIPASLKSAGNAERADPNKIMSAAKAASVSTGIDQGELIEGVRDYVAKSSDFKGGMENMEFFGKLAKGTGTKFSDVTKAAGTLRSQNKNLGTDEMHQMLLDVVMQGKQGAVEFDDLAGSAGKVARSAVNYQGSQTDNQRKLLGLAQIGIRTSGSVAESSTVLSNLSADALKHQDKVQSALGKDLFNDKGQITSPEDLIGRAFKATNGDLGKVGAMGFGARSMKMFQALAPTFNDAQEGALKSGASKEDSTKSGVDAVLKEIKDVTGSKYDDKQLNEDFKNVIGQPAEEFEGALRNLKQELGSQLLPEFVKLVPVIKDMVPIFVDLSKTALPAFVELIKSLAQFADQNKALIHDMAAHPIGTIMAFEVTKSIGAAMLGETIKGLIKNTFTSGGAPGGGGGGPGGGPGLGTAAAAAAITYAGAKPIVDSVLDGQTSGQMDAGKYISTLKNGSPAARAQAVKELQDMQKQYTSGQGNADLAKNVAMTPASSIYSLVSGEKNTAAENVQKSIRAREILDTEELKALLAQALQGGIQAGTSGASGGAHPPQVPLSHPLRGGTQ
jgi:hypothetical protein